VCYCCAVAVIGSAAFFPFYHPDSIHSIIPLFSFSLISDTFLLFLLLRFCLCCRIFQYNHPPLMLLFLLLLLLSLLLLPNESIFIESTVSVSADAAVVVLFLCCYLPCHAISKYIMFFLIIILIFFLRMPVEVQCHESFISSLEMSVVHQRDTNSIMFVKSSLRSKIQISPPIQEEWKRSQRFLSKRE